MTKHLIGIQVNYDEDRLKFSVRSRRHTHIQLGCASQPLALLRHCAAERAPSPQQVRDSTGRAHERRKTSGHAQYAITHPGKLQETRHSGSSFPNGDIRSVYTVHTMPAVRPQSVRFDTIVVNVTFERAYGRRGETLYNCIGRGAPRIFSRGGGHIFSHV